MGDTILPMARVDRRLERMRLNPQGDWGIEDLKAVADRHGIAWRQPGGSHVTFRRPDGRKLTVPARRPVKPVYVRLFVAFVEDGDDIA